MKTGKGLGRRILLSEEGQDSQIRPHEIMTWLGVIRIPLNFLFWNLLLGIPAAAVVFFLRTQYFIVNYWQALPAALAFVLAFSIPLSAMNAIEGILYRRNFVFALEKEYVFTRTGTIEPTYLKIPYENIQDVRLDEGVIENLTGTKTVTISTPAGYDLVPLIETSTAIKLKEALLSLAERHRNLSE